MIKEMHQFTIFEDTDGEVSLYDNQNKKYGKISNETKEKILSIINSEWNSEKTTSSIVK